MGGGRAVCAFLVASALAACGPHGPGLALRPSEPASTPPPAGLQAGPEAVDARRAILRPAAASLVERLNAERAALGLPSLEISDTLSDLAFARAEDMTARGFLASQDPATGQPLPLEPMLGAGFEGNLAEVLGSASPGVQDLGAITLAEWLASPTHRAVLLDPVYRYAGAGLMTDGHTWKVVLLLAERAPETR